ncbi:8-amino-7-oxononanoate synthase [Candidatus Frackibacter sp. WG12]|uniref:8-amino-7-oxononanoate synthase n=1 Tax=Candidatus Frackibacter sp. WG11 TaxID=2017976 RepID=UPI0007922D0C|nr:MAG: glycine C-acetyltransferase [Candidatus Frackibacter sp. T328-2]SDC17894.1 8-amino-7-oxononanoate synthase [Candidatus Frackibacter sp. WG11]SEM44155.1 8-amino-7-oxononanoate synthase [Candidatus Frackibacter sp. WG12]SFL46664.1 8-amino-7-oxononanoate synthase [Candidatus Frackibacter sp. WG13]
MLEEWHKELSREIDLIKQKGLYRQLKRLESSQAPRTVINGKEVIMLASNNYLGLTIEPEIKQKTIETVKEYGTGSGGSRLTTGNYDLHQSLESELANFKDTEAAIIFNTGYMANLGVLTTVVGQKDLIISDELNHASIIDGCRLSKAEVVIYKHKDLKDLELKLQKGKNYRRILIVTDGVFSMDGDLTPLPGIVDLASKYQALVMVDDAHGTGVLGESGAGIVEHFNLKNEVDIQVGTLSKALAAEGGFIAGNKLLVDLLRNKARSFIYSTALAPSAIEAGLSSLQYLYNNPQILRRLWRNINLLKSGLKDLGYQLLPSNSPIIPIMIGDEEETIELSHRLLEEGILAPGIRPPTVPKRTSRIRTTVMANHQIKDIEEALEVFAKLGRELNLI